MKIKIEKGDIWIWLYLYLTFQTLFQSITSGIVHRIVQYSDDLIVMLLLALLFFGAIKGNIHLEKKEGKFLISFALFEVIGIACGVLFGYNKVPGVLLDAFTCAKFIIVFLASWKLSENTISDQLILKMNSLCQVVAILFFVLTLHELFFEPIWEKAEYRYFTYSIKLFFSHPEGLARASFSFILPLMYNMKYHKENIRYILMLCFVMLFTFRAKSIAAMLVILMIYFYKKILKGKHIVFFMAMIGIIVLIVGADQMKYYYSHALIGRTKLLTDAVILANEKFPFGTGFGSFGSNVALDYHSLLYETMGYFNQENPWAVKAFLNDAFWPIPIAQTGWIGTFFFIISLIELIKIGIHYYRKDFYISWVFISVVMYDLISTPASSAFFHPLALSSYLFVGLLISKRKEFLNNEDSVYFSKRESEP